MASKVLAETQALLLLEEQQFPAPTLKLTSSGQPLFAPTPENWAYLHDFIEGTQPAWDLPTLKEVAYLLGRLHTTVINPQNSLGKVDWLDDLPEAIGKAEYSAQHPVWGKFATEVAATLRNLPSLKGSPLGLIHSDVHEGNLLRTPTRQLYLLDWEFAGIGELILDVGQVLGWHCLWPAPNGGNAEKVDADYDEEWCKTFLHAYQQIRPLTRREAQSLDTAIRFVTGWYAARDIAHEIETTGASEGLAFTHWAMMHSVKPTREKLLTAWAIETGALPD